MDSTPNNSEKRRYSIWTIGCQMNEADSRRMAQQLEFVGFQPTENPDDADVIVVNTCVIRQQAENKAVGKLGSVMKLKRKRPDVIVGLMGCMVGMREAPALKKKFPFVDVFMPPSETAPLLDHLEDIGWLSDMRAEEERQRTLRDAIQDEDLPLPTHEKGTMFTANVPIVLGCSHACSFCVIPYRRGAERSRPMEDILTECRGLAKEGIKEVMLLGQIVDRYGVDFDDGTTLSTLLQETSKIEGIERIRFLTSHPNYMTDELLETVASLEKVCPCIEVAVQAGNNEVLENMRREYTHEQYRELIARIRNVIPDVAINTDIIVGFPGETHEQFMETYNLLRDVEHDKTHLSKYSVRPKTIATRQMTDNISWDEKKERWAILEKLQRGIQEKKNEHLRGKTVKVLIEQQKDGNRLSGRTPQGKLVHLEDERDLRGQIIDVRIDWTSAFVMLGRATDTIRSEKPTQFVVT